jgi:hypothetical protein
MFYIRAINPKKSLIGALTLVTVEYLSQDIEQTVKDARNILRKEVVSASGSIGASSVFYRAEGIQPRRDPFYWVLNANLNFTIFDKISVPFSAVITQRDNKYTNGLDRFSAPFNQFGISPKYRWLTVHAGYRTLQFSEYSLSGAMFLGGGVEIAPEKSRVSGAAFFGRFEKAVPQEGLNGIYVSIPSYSRFGGGAKIRIGTEEHNGEFVFLKIKDDVNSIPYDTALTILPQENQLFAITTKQRIITSVTGGGEIALSMFTKNLFAEEASLEKFSYYNQIYTPRTTTTFNKALTGFLDYNPGTWMIGLRYKRVDPDYRTLGSVFLTNDIEEISVNSSVNILKNKISLSTALGLQQNNLDNIQTLTSRRAIGSVNISINLTENLNLNSSYSSFSSNSLPVRDAFTDTVRFIQLNQNANSQISYGWGQKVRSQFTGLVTFQQSNGSGQPSTTFKNATTSYFIQFTESAFGINLSLLYNEANTIGFPTNTGYGPQAGITKAFNRSKIRLGLSAGLQDVFIATEHLNRNSNANFTFQFTIDKHQSAKVDCGILDRISKNSQSQSFREFRGNVGYTYTFGIKSRALKRNTDV